MTDLEFIEYYAKLLIIQYISKTKAPQHIRALVDILAVFELIENIKNGFSVENSVGKQQDIVCKYIGVDRTIKSTSFTRSYWGYAEYEDVAPFDFYPYTSYGRLAPDVQIRRYEESNQSLYMLTDEELRFCMKMKIIQNNSNHSTKEIDEYIDRFFPNGGVYFFDHGDMAISYVFNQRYSRMVQILTSEKLLPKPAGVAITTAFIPDIIFGYSNYSGIYPEFMTGYIEYGATPQGGWLKYGNII